MKRSLLFCAVLALCAGFARGQTTMDTIGVTALLGENPTLTGSGVRAAQVESVSGGLQFEVNPGSPGQPVRLFTYQSSAGISGTFPNRAGTESTHADQVAEAFYGEYTGVSPGLLHVGIYETNFFYGMVIQKLIPSRAPVFNQSFELGPHNAADDLAYDDYIAKYHVVVLSGIGDGGAVLSPSDCYNGLGVAAYGGASSTGPSVDGRCKPDITAPAGATSFSTPLVSGAAAILIQGGRREGVNAPAAVDSRTVKALLLNGAVKPSGWTATPTAPLDPNYGAGILNVFNSYADLAGGRIKPAAMGLSPVASDHPPLSSGTTSAAPQGWDYRTVTSNATNAGVNHYRIATTASGALVSTLVWNKDFKRTAINQLALYLYDAGGNLLAASYSTVDNVQQVYVTGLSPGTYEIEVVKKGGATGTAGVVSKSEVYAIAWDFER